MTDSPSPAVLTLDGVAVVRGGVPLIDEVSWQVHEGERWVVLGPNGAGKTTLLQVAAAGLHPTRGAVTVLGERIGRVDVAEVRTRVGLASAALSSRIPARERVSDVVMTAAYAVLGRWREAYDDADAVRAQGLLDALGVGHLAGRSFGTLSEGEAKRVQVARALMTDPELLLLDEPAAGLDLGAREDLLTRLSTLAADPLAPTSVLVTHHVEEIPAGSTHALLLRGGKVTAAGPVAEVLTAELLSETFGLSLAVVSMAGRWYARARPA